MDHEMFSSSFYSPFLPLSSHGPLQHHISHFIYHNTDVFQAARTRLSSLLMEKSVQWLYSTGVCGHKDIHQQGKTVPNCHLEWVDEDVIIINCFPFVKWLFEPCVSAGPNHFTGCSFDGYVVVYLCPQSFIDKYLNGQNALTTGLKNPICFHFPAYDKTADSVTVIRSLLFSVSDLLTGLFIAFLWQ